MLNHLIHITQYFIGTVSLYLENTISSFNSAWKIGIDYIVLPWELCLCCESLWESELHILTTYQLPFDTCELLQKMLACAYTLFYWMTLLLLEKDVFGDIYSTATEKEANISPLDIILPVLSDSAINNT